MLETLSNDEMWMKRQLSQSWFTDTVSGLCVVHNQQTQQTTGRRHELEWTIRFLTFCVFAPSQELFRDNFAAFDKPTEGTKRRQQVPSPSMLRRTVMSFCHPRAWLCQDSKNQWGTSATLRANRTNDCLLTTLKMTGNLPLGCIKN